MNVSYRMAFAGLVSLCVSLTAIAADVKIIAGPQATRDVEKVQISFAVSAATDVQVSILDGQGKIVRRLAAGLLGKNAPAPFQKDSLQQELVWDGRNDAGQMIQDGKAAFQVKVAAGMAAHYAGPAFGTDPKASDLTSVLGLAVGPDGKVFVLSERWRRAWWTHTAVHVFGRDGKYDKTIKPFPATLSPEKLAKLTPLKEADGHPVPAIHRVLAIDYYPAEDCPQQMAVTPDGNIHLLELPTSYIGDRYDREERFIASLAPDGSLAYDTFIGANLKAQTIDVGDAHLAPASDGKSLFVTGMDITIKQEWSPDDPRPKKINVPAVYRVGLPDRNEARLFFGDPARAGKDDSSLSDPRGLASDGKGSLYVADFGNHRLVELNEATGKFVRSFDVKSPTWVGVNPKTGAVYVASEGEVIKFAAGEGTFVERARMKLPELGPKGMSAKWSFALDGQADSATLWVGLSRGGDALSFCQEQGNKFSELKKADYGPAKFYWSIAPGYDGKTVACKVGDRTLRLLDEDVNQTKDLKLEDSGGRMYRLGPDNQIYGLDHFALSFRRWDSTGKPLPYSAGLTNGPAKGCIPVGGSGTTNWERDFDVDRNGNVFVKQRGKIYHGRMTVEKFDKEGKLVGTTIWVVSDGAQGPRLDGAGNLYIADSIKPSGEPFPDFFKDRLPKVRVDHKSDVEGQYRWMYGSIVKFTPAGGAIWFPIPDKKSDIYPFEGDAKLPANQSKMKIDTISGDRVITRPGELQGAEWMRPGISYILDMQPGANRRCHCTGTDFEVDDYGRTFYTDQGRFRVVVLDTAGNEMLTVGAYGNQDSFGTPGTPDVAFNWFTGLAATDRFIYVADCGNHRIVKLAIQHAAEGTCAVK